MQNGILTRLSSWVVAPKAGEGSSRPGKGLIDRHPGRGSGPADVVGCRADPAGQGKTADPPDRAGRRSAGLGSGHSSPTGPSGRRLPGNWRCPRPEGEGNTVGPTAVRQVTAGQPGPHSRTGRLHLNHPSAVTGQVKDRYRLVRHQETWSGAPWTGWVGWTGLDGAN